MSLFKSLTSKGFQLPKLGAPSPTQVKSVFMPTFWGTKNPDAVTQHAKAIAELAEPGFHFADKWYCDRRNKCNNQRNKFLDTILQITGYNYQPQRINSFQLPGADYAQHGGTYNRRQNAFGLCGYPH